MADNVTTMVMPMLNRIQGFLVRMDEKLDVLTERVGSLEKRMTAVEMAVVGTNHRIDAMAVRFDKLERRQEMTERSVFEASEPFKGPDA